MSSRSSRFVALAFAGLLASGCISRLGFNASDTPERSWDRTLTTATADARARRYSDADRTLSMFAARYPAAAEAHEALYWRALFRMDPANPESSPSTAATLLATYLRSDAAIGHRTEAEAIQRTLNMRAQGGAAGADTAPAAIPAPATSPASAAELKAKDEEIKKLKDDLAKTTEELERIKRRLAAPARRP